MCLQLLLRSLDCYLRILGGRWSHLNIIRECTASVLSVGHYWTPPHYDSEAIVVLPQKWIEWQPYQRGGTLLWTHHLTMKGGDLDLNCPAHTADKRSRYKPPSCVYPICLIQLPQGSGATEGILATTAQNATSLNHASMPLLRCETGLRKLAGWPTLATLLRGYVTWKISSFPWELEIPVCRTKAPTRQRFV